MRSTVRHTRRRRVGGALLLICLFPACGGDDDEAQDTAGTAVASTGTSTAPSSNATGGTEATASSGGSGSPPGGCTGDTSRVGEVDMVAKELLTVDGIRAGDGDEVCDGSPVVTDEQGVADLSLGHDDRPCRLLRSTSITVLAGPVVEYHPTSGADSREQLYCPAATIVGPSGEVLGPELTEQVFVGSQDEQLVLTHVGTEVLTVTPAGRDCVVVIEPGSRFTVTNGQTDLTAFDAGTLAAELVERLPGGRLPAFDVGEPLVPGLASAIDDGDAVLTVDGEPTADASDSLQLLLAGRPVDMRTNEEFDSLRRPTAVAPPSTAGSPSPEPVGSLPPTTTVDDPTTTGETTPDDEPTPAEQPATVDVPVYVDTDGGLWAVRLFVGSEALEDLESTLQQAVRSGAYGRTFREETGRNPPYEQLLPEVLAGADQCS